MEARTGGDGVRTVTLQPHPDTAGSPVTRIEVDADRTSAGSLTLRYRLYGDLARVRLPELTEEETWGREEQLWLRTCFEAFIRKPADTGYLELNFAPWLRWAAYRFTGYRTGMNAANVKPWSMQGWIRPDHIELEVMVDPGAMVRPDLPVPPWEVGLSAVVEDIDGGKSYWALAHPPGKPDFHHSDAFALTLPVPEPA